MDEIKVLTPEGDEERPKIFKKRKINENLFYAGALLLFFSLFLFMFYMYTIVNAEAGKCLTNPKVYYENKTETRCICTSNQFGYENYDPLSYDNINFTIGGIKK